MDKKQAKERIEKLKKLIDYHRHLYHTFDAPEIDDATFDTLKNELEELEHKFPDLVSLDSPTQKIGGSPLDKFVKVRHEAPMLSFNDAFSEEEMEEWMERLENYLGVSIKPEFYCELKIDGLSIMLTYEDGELTTGATRGDGTIGEDVTQNLKTISLIPKKLEKLGKWNIPKHLVVRGEVFITKKELEKINKEQEKKGLKLYANTRNFAAGSIRQLDPKVAASRNLQSFQYEVVTDLGQKTHEEEHRMLASWGFNINPHNKLVRSFDEVLKFRNEWEKGREKLEYEIDGVVVIVNDAKVFDQAGSIGKSPRAAIAYKFSPRQATTVIEDIRVQVGRMGTLTPVAVLRPVEVSGVTIKHATLHNFDEIKRLGIKMGDTVVVTRSGDVIPKITQVIKELRTGKEKEFKMPTKCPVDGSPVKKDGALLKCSNPLCGAKNRNLIIHFASRAAFNIRGLGDKIVDRFIDEGLISNIADIFDLKEGDIASLERFGEKSALNLISEIEKARDVSVEKFLYALGIPQVGEETAKMIAKKFKESKKQVSIKNLAEFLSKLSLDELQNFPDVGPKVAEDIFKWFGESRNKKILEKLEEAGVRIKFEKQKENGIFQNINICITGTLKSISRQRAKEIIESQGGHFNSDVLNTTDILIVGNEPGSKLDKAKKLGKEIWNEKEFLDKIK